MNEVDFNTLNAAWEAIKASGADNLKKVVSGLVDARVIRMKRVGESPESITLMFQGFDQAVENYERDIPLLKRAILAWLKNFAPAQIVRGDAEAFIVIVHKPEQAPQPAAAQPAPMQAESYNHELARISNVRKINAQTHD
jgi:hypothetical protein